MISGTFFKSKRFGCQSFLSEMWETVSHDVIDLHKSLHMLRCRTLGCEKIKQG